MEEAIAKDGKIDDYLAETASRLGSSSEDDNHEEPEVALTDLSYIFFGRAGIYLSNTFIGIGLLGSTLLFYIFFAQTLLSMFDVNKRQYDECYCSIVITLALLQTPVALKRQISELSLQRILSPMGVTCVLLVLMTQIGSGMK